MNRYTLIAGVNGTGKSSLRGVLEGQGVPLGHIIDADQIAQANASGLLAAGKCAIREIERCLNKNISFTQESTLSGKRVEKTLLRARKQGYYVVMFYVGLSSEQESLVRIANRVRKGGHDIPAEDVARRYGARLESLARAMPYCDEITFYDNENGFIKIAEVRNAKFRFTNGYRPLWIREVESMTARTAAWNASK